MAGWKIFNNFFLKKNDSMPENEEVKSQALGILQQVVLPLQILQSCSLPGFLKLSAHEE